jgi:hypothetical protein
MERVRQEINRIAVEAVIRLKAFMAEVFFR